MSNADKMQDQEHDDEQSSDIEGSGDNVGRDDGTDDDDDSNGNMQQENGDGGNGGDGQEHSGDEEQHHSQDNEGNDNSAGQQQQMQQVDRTSATNLIINYLPQDMTDRELYNLFSGCGPINTCKIMRDFKLTLPSALYARQRNRPDIASATASWTTKRSRTRRTPSRS
uniref:Sister-of-Sex-lethal, isoform C n=1 Tax=Drosophila melanogaster TaxID=7227 RepID=X2JA35_DROME|nr:sister-of-Sex-lethal, isoform C [Drosophila melanogaster]AHN59245.1 sister-of-Sex-lethal, isoform C [Drosophila melanogaster]|eukprot:NP_001284774.1 sister-of-Sex-lethal, isoform C [Drosophila melanogaster]